MTPGTDLTVVDVSGKQPLFGCRVIKCRAVKNTLYLAAGQRLALATLSEEGIKALTVNGNGRLTNTAINGVRRLYRVR
ncbi:MAG: hypothetical protein ACLRP3_07195 [Escherichia sp.]